MRAGSACREPGCIGVLMARGSARVVVNASDAEASRADTDAGLGTLYRCSTCGAHVVLQGPETLASHGPHGLLLLRHDKGTRALQEWGPEVPAREVLAEARLLLLDLQGALGRDLPRGEVVLKSPGGEVHLGRLA